MKTITMDAMLAAMMNMKGKTFRLEYIRATGKDKGSIKVIEKASYFAPPRKQTAPAVNKDGTARKRTLHKDNFTVPIWDRKKGESGYGSLFISNIHKFNNFYIKG